MKRAYFLISILLITSCEPATKKESNEKIMKNATWAMPKIDAHVHLNTDRDALMEYGKENNIKYLTVNTDIPFFPALKAQRDTALALKERYAETIDFIASFPLEGWGTEGWADKAIGFLDESLAKDAKAVKFWKNIGMGLKDESGQNVLIDHPSFDPIFKFLEERNVTVSAHVGEPKNCWLPLEEMTVAQDRNYFAEHPEYHMFLQPDEPPYEAYVEARDRRLEKHPDLKFVGFHLGTLEWSTDEIAKFLDRFPNASVDTAERICHLQHQSKSDWQKVRDFFIKYQDRIIYATDVIDDNSLTDEGLVKMMEDRYKSHWEFFATDNIMYAPKVTGSFKGMNLPDSVVRKIYFDNAMKWYYGS